MQFQINFPYISTSEKMREQREREEERQRVRETQRHRYTRREKDPHCIWTVKFAARGNSEYVAFCHPTQFI